MYFRGDAGGQAVVPRQRSYVQSIAYLGLFVDFGPLADVNQFSIITELLGTPPDDVIKTICSENVCILSF